MPSSRESIAGVDRTLRVAPTLADLAAKPRTGRHPSVQRQLAQPRHRDHTIGMYRLDCLRSDSKHYERYTKKEEFSEPIV